MMIHSLLKRLLPASVWQMLRGMRRRGRRSPIFISTQISRIFARPRPPIPDDTWYDLQFEPATTRKYYGVPLPDLPPDDVQLRFTGRTTADNLKQAFSFYLYIRSACPRSNTSSAKVLDFGGGWGRIARCFLRDLPPQQVFIADCLSDSLHWLRATKNPCVIIQNDPLPPIAGLGTDFDLIYAFSVFSHLSEEYANAWINYLMSCLHPGGSLVITTRGHQFIEALKGMHRDGADNYLTQKLPRPQEIEARYAKGEFQFYPTGGGGELASGFYGETFIPRTCFEKKYGAQLVRFTEEAKDVDQAVVVLQRA
jgi:hypothetical protein